MEYQKISPEEIENLVKKAQNGDEESFARIFDYFFPKISRHIAFRVDPEDVEDLAGEIFLKVVQNLKKYTPQKNAGFSAWIFKIAHNSIIDFYRKKKELLGLENEEGEENFFTNIADDEEMQPDEIMNRQLEAEKIHEILKELPALHRTILELKFLEGLSNTEIAVITGKTEGNVRVIQLRALREMRKHWDD